MSNIMSNANDCVIHQGPTDAKGYARTWNASRKKFESAYRLAYEQAHGAGSLPPRAMIFHTCGERLCVNPEHFFVVLRES